MDPYQIEMKEPDPHQSDELDPYPDPHQSDKLDQDPHLFADVKPKSKCMEYVPIWAALQGFEPLFGCWDLDQSEK